MTRATCRCGQVLSLPVNGPDRVICPKCSARVRVRRETPRNATDDGFVRFACPCGRRLKVRVDAGQGQQAGKCPDCGRVVPVPSSSSSGLLPAKPPDPETPTEELTPEEAAALDQWAQAHLARSTTDPKRRRQPDPSPAPEAPQQTVDLDVPPIKAEAGLRVCPRCGRPLHLSAVVCRGCGAPVPKR